MLTTPWFANNTSMQQDNSASLDLAAKQDVYQQLNKVPYTIISLQYDSNEFLTFHVCQATQGRFLESGAGTVGLRCQIGEKIYTFNGEHFNQMSNRECNELFKHLELDNCQAWR